MKNSLAGCHITKTSNEISYTRNRIEYWFLEVTCSDGTQNGLQAYGEEANPTSFIRGIAIIPARTA